MHLLLAALLGCPSEAPEEGAPVAAAPGAPVGDGTVAPPPGETSNSQPTPGTGGPPPGGDGGAGGANGAGGAPGGAPALVQVTPGTGVKVAGTTAYTGTVEGTIRLDVLKKTDKMPELVYSTKLTALGPFEVELPKSLGPSQVTVFIDSTGDGPSPGEPMAASAWIDVEETPVSGVALTLQKLDPNAAPGGASGPPANAGGGGGGHGGGGGGGGGGGAGAGAAPGGAAPAAPKPG